MLNVILRKLARRRVPGNLRKRPLALIKRRSRCGLELEALEDRCVLSVAIASYAIPTIGAAPPSPLGIVAGPDGNLWFTELARGRIGKINPTTHAVADYAIPTVGSLPFAVTAGPDGNLWFTELSKIGAIKMRQVRSLRKRSPSRSIPCRRSAI